jgi:tight adherence protein B
MAFQDRLPDSLQLLSGSLSSGFSLAQALDAVVREGAEPVATEFGRALAESRLGVPVEDTLDRVAERMSSKDFAWVVMAIRIQHDVGGNLAEVLATTAAMMRERAKIKRLVSALAAEGVLSAYILVALPVLMAAFLFSFRRSYFSILYTDPAGVALLVLATGLVIAGALWMRNLVRIDV